MHNTSFCNKSTSLSHPSSFSICGSSASSTCFHNPWPLTNFVGFISKSYSCKVVHQFPRQSPGSFWINKALTAKWGSIFLVWDLSKYRWKWFTTLNTANACLSMAGYLSSTPCRPVLINDTKNSSPSSFLCVSTAAIEWSEANVYKMNSLSKFGLQNVGASSMDSLILSNASLLSFIHLKLEFFLSCLVVALQFLCSQKWIFSQSLSFQEKIAWPFCYVEVNSLNILNPS